MQVSEALDLIGEGKGREFRCRRCQESLGPATGNYKLTALIDQGPLGDANPHIGDPARYVDEEMVYRRFYCPGCGVLLDSEVSRVKDAPLHDIEIV